MPRFEVIVKRFMPFNLPPEIPMLRGFHYFVEQINYWALSREVGGAPAHRKAILRFLISPAVSKTKMFDPSSLCQVREKPRDERKCETIKELRGNPCGRE